MWYHPADTATAVRPAPRLFVITGEEVKLVSPVDPPCPNCPNWFEPQHAIEPLSRTAQVCFCPVDMSTAVRPVPRLIGVDEGALTLEVALPPSPNRPVR